VDQEADEMIIHIRRLISSQFHGDFRKIHPDMLKAVILQVVLKNKHA
jgi:hypothetical protein